jgi:hypothetical protein
LHEEVRRLHFLLKQKDIMLEKLKHLVASPKDNNGDDFLEE